VVRGGRHHQRNRLWAVDIHTELIVDVGEQPGDMHQPIEPPPAKYPTNISVPCTRADKLVEHRTGAGHQTAGCLFRLRNNSRWTLPKHGRETEQLVGVHLAISQLNLRHG
jgi:hypothetical protein